jgi:hypothetical protein
MCVIERKGESVWVFVSAFLRNSYTHTHIHAQPLIDETVCDANDCAEDIGAECVAHTNSTYYCDCSAVLDTLSCWTPTTLTLSLGGRPATMSLTPRYISV